MGTKNYIFSQEVSTKEVLFNLMLSSKMKLRYKIFANAFGVQSGGYNNLSR